MRARCWSILLALHILFSCLPARADQPSLPSLRALLVACDDFVSQPDTAPSSYNNLIAIRRALLRDSRGYRGIRVSLNQALDGAGFAQLAAQAFAGAREGDISLLYLSTHGLLTPTGDDFVALMSDGVTESRLTGADMHAVLRDIPGTKVILVDACYSGALINKGMDSPLPASRFSGPDFKVITSAGGREPSFLWVDSGGSVRGGSYFARALEEGISARGRFAADGDRDGVITLSELHAYLLRAYGASTPQAYPQREDFPLFVYDPAIRAEPFSVTNLLLERGTINTLEEELAFTYTLHSPTRLAYQLVYQREGSWRFHQPQSIMAPGRADGVVLPGRKAAALSVQQGLSGLSGYALLLLVSVQEDLSTPQACVLVSVQTGGKDPSPSIDSVRSFSPRQWQEAAFILRHSGPVSYWADVLNAQGEVVASLARGAQSRPLHLEEEGSALWWDGKTQAGEWAAAGDYRLRVSLLAGTSRSEITSAPFTLVDEAEQAD